MEKKLLIYPTLINILLVFLLYAKNLFDNRKAIKSKSLKMNYFKIYSGRVPDYVAVSRQTLKNQFELPIIFYFLISIILYFEQVFFIDLFLAWLFVFSRYIHAYVRLSSNRIKHRSITFQIGFYTLLFWVLKFIYNII
tara:strand:+ start:1668 stop:2081 length:414 start_codon:yes stop_codon:yes gene_type:complete